MSNSHDSGQSTRENADTSPYVSYDSPNALESGSGNACFPPNSDSQGGLNATGFFSWIVISGMTLLMMFLATIKPESELDKKNPKAPPTPAPNELGSFISQGKWIVSPKAIAELSREKPVPNSESDLKDNEKPLAEKKKTTYLVPESFDHGSLAQRWGVSILKNELEGAEEAEKYLAITEERLEKSGLEMSDDQKKMHQSLKTLFESYRNSDFEASSLEDQERDQIKKDLGWLGELALVPEGTPDVENRQKILSETKKSMGAVIGGFLVGGLFMFVGFVLLAGMTIAACIGRLSRKFEGSETNPNIYVETFAIWMILFMGGQIALGAVLYAFGFEEKEGPHTMAAALIPFFGSLGALFWPVIRGVPLSKVASDIGFRSDTPLIDTFLAIPSYLMLLPALFGAVILVAILFALTSDQSPENFGKSNAPSHPIQDLLKEGDRMTLGVVFLVACVAAPIVEETMFRGVLYRHLRGVSQRWSLWVSITIACLINSFIFAAIHPQGILAIPLLMTLAIGFSVVREYRNSIWPPMLMHGISNFVVLSLSVFML